MTLACLAPGFLSIIQLIDAGITILSAFYFFLVPAKFISGITEKYPCSNDGINEAMVYMSHIFQGRSLIVGAMLLFAGVYGDPYVRIMVSACVIIWCACFGLSLYAFIKNHDDDYSGMRSVTLIMLPVFFLLHSLGIFFICTCL